MKGYIEESARKTAVVNDVDVDVVVVGGGMAGVGAAVTAARAGASTVLLEKFGFCGGLATGGMVNVYWVFDDGEGNDIIRGLNLEILERLRKLHSLREDKAWREETSETARVGIRNAPLFDPEAMKYIVERLLIEAGVKLCYHTLAVQPVITSGRVAGVIVEAKEGRLAFRARVVIDATGDADICERAGTPTVETEEETVAAWFRRSDPATPERMDLYGGFLSAAPVVESHEFSLGTEYITYLKGTTSEALTQWEIKSREIIFAKLEKIRAKCPGGKGITVVAAPVLPNVRKTRRIIGEYEITAGDNHREFPDSVFSIGNWQKAGNVFHLPYRCLVPQRVDGLLAAGRCISTAADCWDVFRIITGCVRSGEAAGAAAVCAVRNKTLPRDVNGAEVRHLLEGGKLS